MTVENWGPEQYAKARALLQKPDLSPAWRETVGRAVTRYESLNPGAGAAAPVGLDVLEANPDFQAQKAEAKRQEQRAAVTAGLTPEQAAAYDVVSAEQPDFGDNLSAEEAFISKQSEARSKLLGLPSASGKVEAFRPPTTEGQGGMGDSVSSMLGGNVEPFYEPPLSVFQAAMKKRGVDATGLDENSDQYKQFADEAWAQIYDTAKADGRPVVRVNYAYGDWDPRKLALRGADALISASRGAASGIIPGADEALTAVLDPLSEDDMVTQGRMAEERNPVATTIGTLAGALSPISLGGKLASGVSAAVRGAGGLGRTLLGGIAGGAAAANAEGIAGDVARSAVDAGRGMDTPVLGEDFAAQTALRTGLGAGGGLLGEGLGALGGAFSRRFRSDGPQGSAVRKAEEAGYETDALRGVKRNPELEERFRAANTTGIDPMQLEAGRASKSMAEAALDAQQATDQTAMRELGAFTASAEGQAKVPLNELVDETLNIIRARRDQPYLDDGKFQREALKLFDAHVVTRSEAAAARESGARVFFPSELKELGMSMDDLAGRVKPTPDAWRRTKPGKPATPQLRGDPAPRQLGPKPFESIPGNSIQRRGPTDIQTDKALDFPADPRAPEVEAMPYRGPRSTASPSGQSPVDEEQMVIIVPTARNAQELDTIIGGIDQLAGLSNASGSPDPAYGRLAQAARQVRDRFETNSAAPDTEKMIIDGEGGGKVVTGISALNAKHARAKLDQETTFENAGLPKRVPNRPPRRMDEAPGDPGLTPNEWSRFRNVISSYGKGSQSIETVNALKELASKAGVEDSLKRIQGLNIGESLKEGAQLRSIVGLRGVTGYANNSTPISTRVDHIARALNSDPQQLAKAVTPELRAALKQMRMKKGEGAPSFKLGATIGSRGGALGRRAAVAEDANEGGLTDEDLKNLATLLAAQEE